MIFETLFEKMRALTSSRNIFLPYKGNVLTLKLSFYYDFLTFLGKEMQIIEEQEAATSEEAQNTHLGL